MKRKKERKKERKKVLPSTSLEAPTILAIKLGVTSD
jgi:hypothetical protein